MAIMLAIMLKRFAALFPRSLITPLPLLAQDTPTEKEAARDVLKKMAALEQSLDVPALVTRLTGANAARDQVVARAKELMDKELLTLADDIATHPEIGFEEKRSVSKLTDYLRQHNFTVETGSAGCRPRSWRAFRGNGSPVLGIIAEYEALRGTRARSTATSTRPVPGRHGGGDGDGRLPHADQEFREHRGLWHARRGDGAAEREDGHARSACLRRREHPGPQPRVERDVPAGARLRICCLNIIGAKYIFGGAPRTRLTGWAATPSRPRCTFNTSTPRASASGRKRASRA